MDFRIVLKRSIAAAVSVFVLVVVIQFFVSCGSDYEKPSTTQTQSALISASTLKSWMDAGLVNGTGYDRVVILDITTYSTYTAGHIPGALFVDSAEIAQDRNEGVGTSTYEVLDGYKMDELIQKYGIDGNTTVVFTSQSTLFIPARAYFTFRYWGFPKNRLKLLDGLNPAWNTAYGLTPGAPPVVARSSYSVRNNGVLRDDLRVSLAEMIDYAEGKVPNTVAIDVRSTASTGSYAGIRGSTTGPFNPGPPYFAKDYTVFEGHVKGAKAIKASPTLYPGNTFESVDQLITAFTSTSVGLDSTKTAYVYCIKGYSSAAVFFILDGILGWPAAIYDGSWTQWGQLSGNPVMKGQLDEDSPWRTDIPSRSELISYNASTISAPTFTVTGTGLNDLVSGGSYTGAADSTFVVTIDSAGTGTTPDTFTWSGSGASGTFVPITGTKETLVSGVTVSFSQTNGHAVGDSWTFTATAGKPVEQFTADANVCSATYNPDGTITVLSGGVASTGTTDCFNKPKSDDSDGNRIEEEDRAYMKSGGSGGTSSGGTSVPAGC